MSEENRPAEAVPEGADVTPSGGDAKVSESLSLEEINKLTGRDYKDIDTAKKAVAETYKHVGKPQPKPEEQPQGTAPSPESNVLGEVQKMQKELEEERFFRKNPSLEPYAETIRKFAGDKPLSEAVEDEGLKTMLGKLQLADETEKKKSVLMSSPRLGAQRDKIKEAADAAAKGDHATAAKAATSAVIDAFELDKR